MSEFMLEYENSNDEFEYENSPTDIKSKDDEKSDMFKIKKCYSVKFDLEKNEIIKFQKRKESGADHLRPAFRDRFRSKSHLIFKYRPEMVPQIKPKISSINPSPMKLHKRKSFTGIDAIDFDNCPYSDNDNNNSEIYDITKEDDFDSLDLCNTQDLSPNEKNVTHIDSINMLRQEMARVKLRLINSNEQHLFSREFENILKSKIKMNIKGSINDNKQDSQNNNKNTKIKKRKSLWKKFIINQHKESDFSLSKSCFNFGSDNQNNSNEMKLGNYNEKINEDNSHQHENSYSILNILECAANERKLLRKSNIY